MEKGRGEGKRMIFPLKRLYSPSHEFFEHGNLCRGFWKQNSKNKQLPHEELEEFVNALLSFPFFSFSLFLLPFFRF